MYQKRYRNESLQDIINYKITKNPIRNYLHVRYSVKNKFRSKKLRTAALILSYGYRYRVGSDFIARAVLHDAIELNAVPSGVGGDGLGGMSAVFPQTE